MATILHKRKTADPSASDLTVGELAINTQDGGVFTKTTGGSVVEIGSTGGTADNTSTFTTNSTDANTTFYPVFVDGTSGNQGAEVDTGLTYNPSTGVLTTTSVTGNLTGNVTGNTSGTAATVTGAAQSAITSVGTLTGLTVAGDITLDNGTNSGKDVTWDESNNHVVFADDTMAKFGAGGDMTLYHTGTVSYVTNSTGDLYIQTTGSGDDVIITAVDDIFLKPQGGENGIEVLGDGAVKIFHDSSKKFETTSTGATITGLMSATTIDGAAGDNLSLDFGSVA